MRRAALALSLALVYLMLLPELHPADVLVALAVGALVGTSSPPRVRARAGRERAALAMRLGAAAGLVAGVLAEAARGTWRVTRMTLGLAELPAPGYVTLPMGAASPRRAALHGFLVTLSPGSVLVALEPEERVLVFHVVGIERARFERSVARLQAQVRVLLGSGGVTA